MTLKKTTFKAMARPNRAQRNSMRALLAMVPCEVNPTFN